MGKMKWKDRNWLFQKYVVERKSTIIVAREAGCDHKTIWLWIRKFDFKIRGHSEAVSNALTNHLNLSRPLREFLKGEMLGDGHLRENSRWSATYECASKYFLYSQWLSETLKSFGAYQAGKILKRKHEQKSPYKTSITYRYRTRSYAEFHMLWENWYRKGRAEEKYKFVKIIPQNLELSPLACRQWFIGDGHLHKKKGITLSTQGFAVSEVYFLMKLLNNLQFATSYKSAVNSIYIPKRDAKCFLNFIGSCPIENIYGYKWAV